MPTFMLKLLIISTYTIFSTAPILFVVMYPFRNKLRVKKTTFIIGILLLLIIECYASACVIFNGHFFRINYIDGINLLSYYIYYLYSCIMTKDKISKLTFSWLMIILFAGLIALPTMLINQYLVSFDEILLRRTILYSIEFIPFVLFCIRFQKLTIMPLLKLNNYENTKLCTILLFVIVTITYIPTWNLTWLMNPPIAYPAIRIAGAVVAYILTIIFKEMVIQNEKLLKIQHEKAKDEQLLAVSREYFKSISKKIDATRRLKHDFKHKLIVIDGLAKEEKCSEISEYLQKEKLLLEKTSLYNFTSNYEFNTVLSYYYNIALEKNINCDIKCAMPKDMAIENSDLWVLTGNLFLNAIEANDRINSGKRNITIRIKYHGSLMGIIIYNTFNPESISKNNGVYTTSKNDLNTTHGHGLKSIQMIAKKYNGKAEFTTEDNIFKSKIYLYL